MRAGLIIVGTGKWGRNHVTTASALNALLAIVDTNPSALSEISHTLPKHVTLHSTLQQALQRHRKAGVIIATPPSTHYSLAKEALLSGHHVLVEKPFCVNLAHAAELVQIAERERLVLMVDHLLQYAIHHRRLLRLVSDGFVGELKTVRMSRLNFGTVRLEENVLWSFSPHDISIMLSICSGQEPRSVSCMGQQIVSTDVDDYINLVVEFENGVSARIEASWMHPLKERRTIVYGTNGSVILNEASPDACNKLQAFKWSAKRRADGTAVEIAKDEQHILETVDNAMMNDGEPVESMLSKQPLQLVQEHFLSCIESGDTPRTDGVEALHVITILTAASESLEKGGAKVMISPWPREKHNHIDSVFVHSSAVIDPGAIIGPGSKVWHFSHIMPGAILGAHCNIGQNVFIGGRARLGNNVKVQNNVSIYDRVEIDDDAFLGPSCVFTNVKTPRSHISRKHDFAKTVVGKGATVGANATIVCGTTLGKFCFVGAGAVVTKDVPPHAMVYGNPAVIQGWVSTTGARLVQVDSENGSPLLRCEESGETYILFASVDGKEGPQLRRKEDVSDGKSCD